MKNISIAILSFSLLVFSCSKEDVEILEDKTSGDYLALSDAGGEGGSSGSSTGDGQDTDPQIDAGQITAGEWNDLDNWEFWKNLGNEEEFSGMATYWSYDLGNRISVSLTNSSAVPLTDIKVELLNKNEEVIWVNRTDNYGTAELWPNLISLNPGANEDLKIRIEGEIFSNILNYSEGINEISLSSDPAASETKSIDIAFMVDATGSMSDELEYLKVELVDVIEQVQTDNPETNLMMGSVFYRDEGDNYVTRKSDFSMNVNQTINFINDQSASGGGDFPEAVHTALNVSINNLQWSSTATARLLFVLLDAPPHYESQIIDQIHSLTAKAAENGIKIIPITASGINKETEFLMRYMSIATNGTYVFITNHSGIGNEHLEPSIGEYQVEYLNDLMVRLINKYLQ